jgi:hypothetical protein
MESQVTEKWGALEDNPREWPAIVDTEGEGGYGMLTRGGVRHV